MDVTLWWEQGKSWNYDCKMPYMNGCLLLMDRVREWMNEQMNE